MKASGAYDDNFLLAELYDLVPLYVNRPDQRFYPAVCKEANGEILELGCGTGRILIPAAEAGCRITGLDFSPNMLHRCREKLSSANPEMQGRVRLIKGNMIDFQLASSFHLVTMPFRVMNHLISVKDQLSCLSCINRHLEMKGKLIVDTFQPDFDKLGCTEGDTEIEDTPEYNLPDGRKLRRTHRVTSFYRAEQFMDVEMIYYLTDLDGSTQRVVQAFPFRFFFRYELEHLLARCGFEVINLYGDFDKSPLGNNSPEMIFVAEKCRELK